MEDKKSIWNVVPEAWRTEEPPAPPAPVPVPQPAPEPPAPAAPEPTPAEKRKQERADLRRYVQTNEHNMKNAAEHTEKAYLLEKLGNRRDLIVLAVLLFVVITAVALLLVFFSQMPSQRLHRLIEQENYSLAYHELQTLHEKGDNVDKLVYAFAEQCVHDSEYKRAVASLEFLSPEAGDPAFFRTLVEAMLRHDKQARAMDVLDYMNQRGGDLARLAEELLEEHRESFYGKE